jgi:hypothetical protein
MYSLHCYASHIALRSKQKIGGLRGVKPRVASAGVPTLGNCVAGEWLIGTNLI